MITAVSNQSLLDIAIQEDGNILAVFEWALANGISITEELVPGQKLIVPSSLNRDNDIAQYFKSKTQNIATSYKVQLLDNSLDYMFAYEFAISL